MTDVLVTQERQSSSEGAIPADALREIVAPWADHHGDLPEYDHPLACVFDSGVQYAVVLLAKELKVDDWTPCDGTEEYDGDLGGTLMNIVLNALPKDEHGDEIHPSEFPKVITRAQLAMLAATPTPPAGSQRGDDALREADARDANERISAAMMGMVPGAISTEETELPGGSVSHRTFVKCSYDDLRIVLAALDAFATPVPHKADEGVRERIARALYDSSPHTVISPALSDLTGLPVGSVLTFDAAVAAGADMAALYRYADAVLTLSPAPCLSDERDKLEAEIFRLRDALKTIRLEIGPAKAYAEECGLPGGKFPSAVHIKLDLIDGYARAALDTPSTGEEGK